MKLLNLPVPVSSAINKHDNPDLIGVLGGLNELIHITRSVSKVPGTKEASGKHGIRQTPATQMKEAASESSEGAITGETQAVAKQPPCFMARMAWVTFKMLPTVSP